MGAALTNPFWNAAERRARAFWRVLIVVVAVFALMVLVAPWLDGLPTALEAAIGLPLELLIPLVVVLLGARFLDRRRLTSYGLHLDRRWWSELGLGALLGLVMYAAAFGVIVAAGWGRVTDFLSPGPQWGFWPLFLVLTASWLINGIWEELVMRGVMMKNAAEGFAGRISRPAALVAALLVSTVVFAVIHIPDYLGAEVPMSRLLVTWLLLGGLLGLTYALTGRLGMAIGLHFTVNLAINNLFGLFGQLGDRPALIHTEITGPSGLAEVGGAVHIGAILLGYLLVVLWAWRRPQGLTLAEELTRPPETVRMPEVPGDEDAHSRARDTESVRQSSGGP